MSHVLVALLTHTLTPILFVSGVLLLNAGWGRDPFSFALGLLQLVLAAAFVWTTADAAKVTREARR